MPATVPSIVTRRTFAARCPEAPVLVHRRDGSASGTSVRFLVELERVPIQVRGPDLARRLDVWLDRPGAGQLEQRDDSRLEFRYAEPWLSDPERAPLWPRTGRSRPGKIRSIGQSMSRNSLSIFDSSLANSAMRSSVYSSIGTLTAGRSRMPSGVFSAISSWPPSSPSARRSPGSSRRRGHSW
jgi:hypothetical protein